MRKPEGSLNELEEGRRGPSPEMPYMRVWCNIRVENGGVAFEEVSGPLSHLPSSYFSSSSSVTFVWVPGQTGIAENELVDHLAKKASDDPIAGQQVHNDNLIIIKTDQWERLDKCVNWKVFHRSRGIRKKAAII
ncbi:hypothetical protein CEXT_732091 [Caerostris extrusa]|uniref:RNase H type-1 domain-containing protein n=1 Tax=Caerostris extrusa TaxID=172846 RepID=A0AAV4T750_CAEEX|nr:hypothetical protein CEXT_732091 [Caerostris extrusa]